jgi:transcriptional regulator with XRE-family HTH domain
MSSQEVKSLRKAKGWSVQMLAHAAGVNHSTVRRYEEGRNISSESLARIVEALNASR